MKKLILLLSILLSFVYGWGQDPKPLSQLDEQTTVNDDYYIIVVDSAVGTYKVKASNFYRDRWSGTATGLNASTARSSLGAVTLGSNIFTITNYGGIGFIRINADNSVTPRSIAETKVDLGIDDIETDISTLTTEQNDTLQLIFDGFDTTYSNSGKTLTISSTVTGGGYDWIHFIVDSTTNAPSSGDSSFVITDISGYKLDIWKGTQYGNLMKLVNRDSIGWTISGDTITIRPPFDAYDNVEIHATANSGVDTMSVISAFDALMNDGNTIAWYNYHDTTGMTISNDTTVTAWDDYLDSGVDLELPTNWSGFSLRDSGMYVLNDTWGEGLQTATFDTIDQPITVILLMQQNTWTVNRQIFDGRSTSQMAIIQGVSSPGINFSAGNASSGFVNNNLALGSWGILRVEFNGASSEAQVDETTKTTGSYGTNSLTGITIGSRADGSNSAANVGYRHIIVREGILTDSQINVINDYLNTEK